MGFGDAGSLFLRGCVWVQVVMCVAICPVRVVIIDEEDER